MKASAWSGPGNNGFADHGQAGKEELRLDRAQLAGRDGDPTHPLHDEVTVGA